MEPLLKIKSVLSEDIVTYQYPDSDIYQGDYLKLSSTKQFRMDMNNPDGKSFV